MIMNTNNEMQEAINKFKRDTETLNGITHWVRKFDYLASITLLVLSTLGLYLCLFASIFKGKIAIELIGVITFICGVTLIMLSGDKVYNFMVSTIAEKELLADSIKHDSHIEFIQSVRRYGKYVVISDFDIINETSILVNNCDGELGNRVNETYVRINAKRKNIKYYKYVISLKQARDLDSEKRKNKDMLLVLTDSEFHNSVRAVS